MARARQIVLMKPGQAPGQNEPLGTLKEVAAQLASFNTAPDGATIKPGSLTTRFHGPGIVVEIATGQPEVSQALVSLIEEDTAWAVLMRLAKTTGWSMLDVETGRRFG